VTGVALAAVAGIGFGLFQSVNRAALRGMDAYASTFLQVLVSAALLVAVSLAAGDPGRLAAAPASSWWWFAAAGLVHFSVGWTLLNLSQQRLGAARTSPLLATVPLFGVMIAAVALREVPSALELAGVGLMVAGVYAIEADRAGSRSSGAVAWTASLFGLGTALCWAVSPILIRQGLRDLPSPLLGVTVGLVAATLAYGLTLPLRGGLARRSRIGAAPRSPAVTEGGDGAHRGYVTGALGVRFTREALAWKLAAGGLVAASTWARWTSVALVPVAVVLALGLLSVPTVLAAAPALVGRQAERVTAPVLAGAALIVAGALVIGAGS
jgi:drug/metabolite transporter, DME family